MASSRVRAFWIADALRELGHDAEVTVVSEYSFGAFVRYLRLLLSAKNDTVYLQRTIYNKYFFVAVLFARLFGTRFLFDFDDPVYVHSPQKTAILARLSRAVICGSTFIEQWARKHSPRTLVLMDGVPLSIYTTRECDPESLCIGWIGNGPAHYENLRMLPGIFKRLNDEGVTFRFRLIGALGDKRIYDLFKDVGCDIVDLLDWSDPRHAVREIHTFSVGIMPLVESPWGNAKYFKLLEYMACGVPVVASPTDTTRHVVQEGGAGVLADTEDEWVRELSRLLRNAGVRTEEGRKGRKLVEQRYSTRVIAQTLLDYVKSI